MTRSIKINPVMPYNFKSVDYTEQDYHNEGCCWDWIRDTCPGLKCLCVCHKEKPGEPKTTVPSTSTG